MRVAGLTGGIASGKSTVSSMFQRAGAIIIDADVIAHQVVEPGLPAWQGVKSLFGDGVLGPDGYIDRAVLGEMVFKDPKLRKQLEEIVHPQVRIQIDREMGRLRHRFDNTLIIQDIPLLLETGMADTLSEIIVVYAPMAIQLKRLMCRQGIGADAARARINAQMPLDEKCRRATIVIDNSGDLSATQKQVLHIYELLSGGDAGKR
ncbi:MAG: dephospho-CoA kinase [Desulfobacteraceae bacterium]